MPKRIYRTTFQFKRSTARKWYQLNPTLAQGEPGYEIDSGKVKIGNGVTPWRKLDYINGNSSNSGVYNGETIADFPQIGSSQIIYKASAERALYQFNENINEYEIICKYSTDETDTIIIDDTLSIDSSNAVQNKVVTAALNDKVDKVEGKGLSTNDYSDSEKLKLYKAIENIENMNEEINSIKAEFSSGETIQKLDGGLI